jgi:hypothetical protein
MTLEGQILGPLWTASQWKATGYGLAHWIRYRLVL